MTRSPLVATLIPLVPLAALGWPLARVINQKAYQAIEVEKTTTAPLITADLFVRSAHPFSEVKVKIGETTWTYASDEEVKEIHFPRDQKATLLVSIVWPEHTPETAAILTLRPHGELDRSHTLWGFGEVTEEVTFTWAKQP